MLVDSLHQRCSHIECGPQPDLLIFFGHPESCHNLIRLAFSTSASSIDAAIVRDKDAPLRGA